MQSVFGSRSSAQLARDLLLMRTRTSNKKVILWQKLIPILAVVLSGCQTLLPLSVSYTLNLGGEPQFKGYCILTRTFDTSSNNTSYVFCQGAVVKVASQYRNEWNVLMCRVRNQEIPAHYLRPLTPLEVIEYRLDQ